MKLGDRVAPLAQIVAQGLDSILGTNLKDCQGCRDRQQQLNNFGDVFYSKLFGKTTKGEPMAEEKTVYLLQVAIEATDLIDACNNFAKGKVVMGAPKPSANANRGSQSLPAQQVPPRPPLAPVQKRPV